MRRDGTVHCDVARSAGIRGWHKFKNTLESPRWRPIVVVVIVLVSSRGGSKRLAERPGNGRALERVRRRIRPWQAIKGRKAGMPAGLSVLALSVVGATVALACKF